jgi:hypothetical protein
MTTTPPQRNWVEWTADLMKRAFWVLVEDNGFIFDGPVNRWYKDGLRFHRGNLGIEIVSEMETGSKIAVWIRHLPNDAFANEQWTPSDFTLDRFAAANGLPWTKVQPSIGTPDLAEANLDHILNDQAECLKRALPMLADESRTIFDKPGA